MAKIGLDLRFYRAETGGLGRYSRNLLAELLKLDTENQYTAIITPKDKAEFTLEAPNLRTLIVDIPHFSVAEQRQLPKILNEQKFDLVHFANFNHPIWYRRPFVVTIHDVIMHLFPGAARQRSIIHRLAYKKVFTDCRRAKTIIVPSQSTKKDLVGFGFPANKILVTPEGSEAKFAPQPKAAIEAVRQKFGLPPQFLLFVSRWEKYKGLPALLEAYDRLHQEFPDLGLVLCGRPDTQQPDVAELVNKAKAANPLVITPGFVTDEELAALYSAATAYVHPSWYEGFGIMILEAFAAGAPVVTSNISSLPEVVGDAGLLVDPKNIDDLTAAIRQVVADPKLAETFRQKGFERVKQFSWKKMAEQTLQAYRQTLADHG